MIGFLVRKIFGSKNDRFLKKLRPLVAKINALEPEMQALADEELPQRLAVYREQVQNGEKDLDAVLPEVFALVREASTRVLGMRHYDVQLLGAMALHNGKIAEMKTGEGKTLVATLAVILNSLEGKGVHVVTVNDYLAKRDAEWMGRLYNFLGLSVGVIVAGLSDEQRKEAYGADITYGTNNEFGFDYLRDNMAIYKQSMVQPVKKMVPAPCSPARQGSSHRWREALAAWIWAGWPQNPRCPAVRSTPHCLGQRVQ